MARDSHQSRRTYDTDKEGCTVEPGTRHKWLIGVLTGVAAIWPGWADAQPDASATPREEKKAADSAVKKSVRKQIRDMLLAGLKPAGYNDGEDTAGSLARKAITPLLAVQVKEGKLSQAAADAVADMHRECVTHAVRSMASCYEPLPMDWVGWESGGGAREKACKKLELLEDLDKKGNLDKKTVELTRKALVGELHYLDTLRDYIGTWDKEKKGTLKKRLLDWDAEKEKPDKATTEAAAFVLSLFEK